MQLELRNYQKECVQLTVAAFEQARAGRELLVLPTGAGKTVVFCQVINLLAERHGINALIIAHRDELLDQAADKYRMVKPEAIIGKVGSGMHEYGGEVTVASIATISRPEHIKKLKAIGYGLIIVDEAHHVAADGYQRVLDALPGAFVLMVTATPDRLDKKEIQSEKPPLYSASIIDMIKQGYLCDVKAIAIRTHVNLDDLHSQAGDFKVDELETAVNTPERNKRVVDAYIEHAYERRAICFGVTVSHATALSEAFNDAGISAGMVSGETPIEERKKLYKALRDGTIKVLTNVQVLTEGFDEPLVDCIIMARPTQSRALYVQCVGRGLRLAPAKQNCVILDLTDNCLKHRLEPQNLSKALGKTLQDNETVGEAEEREKKEAAERETRVRKLKDTRTQDIQIDLMEKLIWQERTDGMFLLEVGAQKHRIAIVADTEEEDKYIEEPFNGDNWCKGCYQEKIIDEIQLENRNHLTKIHRCSKCDYWNFTKGDGMSFAHTPTTKIKTKTGLYTVWARLAPVYDAQMWAQDVPLDWAQQLAERKARLLLADKENIKLVDRNAPWRFATASEKQRDLLKRFGMEENALNPFLTKGEASDILDPIFERLKQRKQQKSVSA